MKRLFSTRTIKGELETFFHKPLHSLLNDKQKILNFVDSNRKDADYAFASAMEIFRFNKSRFKSPEDVADHIIASLPSNSNFVINKASFYVNILLTDSFISSKINSILENGISNFKLENKNKILIDYSSPNVAKEMHVGHLRSTVIGNSLSLIYEFLGHEVVRVNHLGDWGTQFGTILQYVQELKGSDSTSFLRQCSLKELNTIYRDSKEKFKLDQDFASRAKETTVNLQMGDPNLIERWKLLTKISIKEFQSIYVQLGLQPSNNWYVGESFYQDKIGQAIKELDKFVTRGQNDKSILLFTGIPESKIKNLDKIDEIPLVLTKSDGGLGYDATDVAAIRYRLIEMKADKVLYVTDSGQSLHFQLVFAAARLAGWSKDSQQLVHVHFGLVTKGNGGGKIKTREGSAPTLQSLIDASAERMQSLYRSRFLQHNSDDQQKLSRLSQVLGVCSIVFTELKTNRLADYEFCVNKMCNPDGDTAVFLFYVLQKLKKSNKLVDKHAAYNAVGASLKERRIAILVCKFFDTVVQSASTNSPHHLCAYLCNLAKEVSSFIDSENLSEIDSERRETKLALLKASSKVLIRGLQLLGINKEMIETCQTLIELSTPRENNCN